jgi:hypothetical protein
MTPHFHTLSAAAASSLMVLSGCASEQDNQQFRSYDLALIHTSPYSTYIAVAPGSRGGDVPRIGQLDSKAFSEYLKIRTGCSVDDSRKIHRLGHERNPAGYMVPISCL